MARPTPAEIADQNERTTALGLAGRAVEHFAAAVAIQEAIGEKTKGLPAFAPMSADHIMAMAIEVGLKAFLRERGLDVLELKSKFGHDLERLFDRAQAEGLPCDWSSNRQELLRILNTTFLAREFEFTRTGVQKFVEFELLVQLAAEILRAAIASIPAAAGFLNGKTGEYLSRYLSSKEVTT